MTPLSSISRSNAFPAKSTTKPIAATATPKGMAGMLGALNRGKRLSPCATRYILDVLAQTVTFPDGLKAGGIKPD